MPDERAGLGDAVLAFFRGLAGGGGNGEAPPVAPESGSDPRVPWEEPSLGGGEPIAAEGSAAPVAEAPVQTNPDSLIEALQGRNKEFAPYRDTGIR